LGSLAVPELASAPEIVDPILEAQNAMTIDKMIRARKLFAAGNARAKALQQQWLSRPSIWFRIEERRRNAFDELDHILQRGHMIVMEAE